MWVRFDRGVIFRSVHDSYVDTTGVSRRLDGDAGPGLTKHGVPCDPETQVHRT
jgi:hypothetical protein